MKNEIRGSCCSQDFSVGKVLYVCSLAHSHIGTFFLQKQKMDSTAFPTLNHLKIFSFQYSVCIHFWYLKERQLTWDMPKIPNPAACNSFKGNFPTFKLPINLFILNAVLVVENTLVHSLITGLAR